MAMLHDPATRDAIKARVQALTASSSRRWGRMTPDQMCWHCAEAIDAALGKVPYEPMKGPPLPAALMRWLIVAMPWPKGKLDTAPQFVAGTQYDFAAQKQRLLACIDEFTAKPLNSSWGVHPVLGTGTGEFQSRLEAKHLNHHLTQFGT